MSDLLKVKIGGHDYLCKWESPLPHGLVYLTYFEDIVASDSSVTPTSRKGPTGTYGNGSAPNGASTELIPQEGGEYAGVPALHLNYLTSISSSINVQNEPVSLLHELFTGSGSVSIEIMLYIPTFYAQGGNYWMGLGINDPVGQYFTLGINTYSFDRGILVGFPYKTGCNAASGFHAFWHDGSRTVSFSSDDSMERRSTGIHHIAVVIDRANNETRGYIDGTLAGTMASASFDVTTITPYNALNHTILMTQFAIFADERSTDNGATYPVPTKPYVKF